MEMDLDLQQQHADQARTALSRAWSQHHVCSHTCNITHMFGNTYQCSSGQIHVCDGNCDKRVYCDRYTEICVLSKKRFEAKHAAPLEHRKRGCCSTQDVHEGKKVCTPLVQPFGSQECYMEA